MNEYIYLSQQLCLQNKMQKSFNFSLHYQLPMSLFHFIRIYWAYRSMKIIFFYEYSYTDIQKKLPKVINKEKIYIFIYIKAAQVNVGRPGTLRYRLLILVKSTEIRLYSPAVFNICRPVDFEQSWDFRLVQRINRCGKQNRIIFDLC